MPLYDSRTKRFDPWLTQKPDLNTKVSYSCSWTARSCFGRIHKSFFTQKSQDKSHSCHYFKPRQSWERRVLLCSCVPSLWVGTHLSSSPVCLPKTTSKLKFCQQGKRHQPLCTLLPSQRSCSSPLRAWLLWKSWKSHSPAPGGNKHKDQNKIRFENQVLWSRLCLTLHFSVVWQKPPYLPAHPDQSWPSLPRCIHHTSHWFSSLISQTFRTPSLSWKSLLLKAYWNASGQKWKTNCFHPLCQVSWLVLEAHPS